MIGARSDFAESGAGRAVGVPRDHGRDARGPDRSQPIAAVPRRARAALRGEAAAIALTLFDHDTPVWLDATSGGRAGRRGLAALSHRRADRRASRARRPSR